MSETTTCTRCNTQCLDYRQEGNERLCICCVWDVAGEREAHARRHALSTIDGLRTRLRTTAQTLIAEVGADGPTNAEDAAARAIAAIKDLRTRLEVMERERETDALLWRSAVDIAESNAREGERALAERDEARRERDEAREALRILVHWHDQDGRVDESWWQHARMRGGSGVAGILP